MKQSHRILSVLFNTLCGILITLSFLCFFSAIWFLNNFDQSVGFDAILFTLFSDLNGTDAGVIWRFLLQAALPTVLCAATVYGLLLVLPKILWKKWATQGNHSMLLRLAAFLLILALAASLGAYSFIAVGLDDYIAARKDATVLFDNEYVDPDEVEITFPEEKRNLIYIYLESMENTFLSKEEGGAQDVNLIPELMQLSKDHLNFSQSEGVGGGRTTTGSTWTIAAMITQTAGIPLCLPNGIWENGLNYYSQVLPGVTTLNDILHENGYDQTLMVGSDASFGGRREYFTQHGMDRVYDLGTAREEGLVPSDYWNGFWGFEDHYLFQYAKAKLTDIAKSDQPFAFTLLTVDTHHPDGYRCIYCAEDYDDVYENYGSSGQNYRQFANAIACSSRQVAEFVEWIQEQDFYENTTVIITGDHNSMNGTFMSEHTASDYTRRIYNSFLNTEVTPAKAKHREFTTLDMFPTTLAALGCTIEGDRLGLGVNLFANLQTLTEQYGFDYLCTEISKTSPYYEDNFLYGKKG